VDIGRNADTHKASDGTSVILPMDANGQEPLH